jgi:hypothetical protein
MSGLSRTPGKRVWVNSPPRVRIPPAPPEQQKSAFGRFFHGCSDLAHQGEAGTHSHVQKNKLCPKTPTLLVSQIHRGQSNWKP